MSSATIDRLNAALTGRYVVEREIGEGGMATVFLADDLKHERKVALKVLRPDLAAVVGADRFLAEIKTTANLQHPHILPLFDSGEADSFLFYVMPYVEGETLKERIDRDKQLPVDEAVHIATAVANALHTAHEAGVVHRDIKPGNILMSKGEPLVADFGIALAVGTAGASRLTETGLSVGTPYYMSPEQATGDQAIGAASDIYALAAVLYELLVGEPPYVGNTAQAVLGKILQGAPVSATAQRKSIPTNVDAALRKALEKFPADRFTTAQDFARALGDPGFKHGSADAVGSATRLWNPLSIGTTVAAAVATLAFGWALTRSPDLVVSHVARYETPFRPDQQPLGFGAGDFAISGDGTTLAYVGPAGSAGVPQVWVRRWSDLESTPVQGTEAPASMDISDDGTLLLLQTGTEVRVVPVGGGPEIALGEGRFPRWGGDGFVYWSAIDGAVRAPAEGGAVETLTELPEGALIHLVSQVLPGGETALFWQGDGRGPQRGEIHVLDLSSGETTLVTEGGAPRYVATGHLVYLLDGTLLAAPFDLSSSTLRGPAVPFIEGVTFYTLSNEGRLVYSIGNGGALEELAWVSREGLARPVEEGWSVSLDVSNNGWSLSPDGSRIALRELSAEGNDIWIKELNGGPLSRLTFDEGEDRKPVWGPGPGEITFLSDRNENLDVWRRRADGTGAPELVLDLDRTLAEVEWSANGEWLMLRTGGTGGQLGGRDILALRPGQNEEATPILYAQHDEIAPALSPDGRWLAYTSNETGRHEVFVRPFPEVESGRQQVSTNGGQSPRWSVDGSEIFYRSAADEMMSATVATGTDFSVRSRTVLFTLPPGIRRSDIAIPYDVGHTAETQFLMARPFSGGEDELPPAMVLIVNWVEELKARIPN